MTDKNANVSPNVIEILIHCHCSPEVHPRRDAPAVQEGLKFLYENGLIDPTTEIAGVPPCQAQIFNTTAKGKAWMRLLCTTPFPITVFMDPRVVDTAVRDGDCVERF